MVWNPIQGLERCQAEPIAFKVWLMGFDGIGSVGLMKITMKISLKKVGY